MHGEQPSKLEMAGLTEDIIGAAIEVHRFLGPGLLEHAYEDCLAHELALRKFAFKRQLFVPIEYKGLRVEQAFRLDLLVEDTVVVEVKAVEKLAPIHDAQLLTYLRLTGKRIGLLMNFCAPTLKEGLRRFAL